MFTEGVVGPAGLSDPLDLVSGEEEEASSPGLLARVTERMPIMEAPAGQAGEYGPMWTQLYGAETQLSSGRLSGSWRTRGASRHCPEQAILECLGKVESFVVFLF